MASWARVEEDVRRLKLEREHFNARYSLIGKTVKAAAEELRADGYRCAVGLLDTVRSVPGEFRIVPAKKALIFCELQSTESGDFCAERFVRLAANWPDISQPLSVLEQQMSEVLVTQTTFRCDMPVDAEIDRKKRQEGEQE